MENIKVGEYVRLTSPFGINKVIEVRKDNKIETNEIICPNNDKFIKSHSFNLIDLVEVGDYVNNYRVEEIGETHIDKVKYLIDSLDRSIYEENIISIFTHEQFEGMKYVVGDK